MSCLSLQQPVFTHAEVQLRVTKSHWTNEWPTYDTSQHIWMKWYRINIYIGSRQVNTIKNAEDDFCFVLRQKCHWDWHIRLTWLTWRLLGDYGNDFNKLGHFRSLSPYWFKVQNGAAYWHRIWQITIYDNVIAMRFYGSERNPWKNFYKFQFICQIK